MSEAQPLTLAGGRLAALAWGEPSAPTWLALHGWLDNAASFSRLAPLLCTRLGVRIVALDFSGHGHSLHGAGDYALALELAKKCTAKRPERADFALALALAQYRNGDWRAALDGLDKASSL